MALKATIHKAELTISDLDRGYYATHALTVARHPSETEERMMVRLVAFALFADERLEFGKGLCVDDEPDLWLRDLTGHVLRWIDVGQPDEKWLRKACGRAESVVVLSYGRAADVWLGRHRRSAGPARPADRAAARSRGGAGAGRAVRARHAAAMHDPGRRIVDHRWRAHRARDAAHAAGCGGLSRFRRVSR